MTIKLHLPLIRALGSAAVLCLIMLGGFRLAGTGFSLLSLVGLTWVFAGATYHHLFEYFLHRVVMHKGVRGCGLIKAVHLEHHRIFQGANFRSRNRDDLLHVALLWFTFPTLFALHFVLFLLVLPVGYAPPFFTGVVLYYAFYESCHWFTHVKDNAFDKLIARVPVVRVWRRRQIELHRIHHEGVTINFNFNPPYLGDRIWKTLSWSLRA
jgi:hypothetical protein